MQNADLPPINNSSSLMAVQPLQADVSMMQQPVMFDTQDLQSALNRSQQASGSGGGLRRAVSLPQEMSSFAEMHAAPLENLPPSGGPMRRVASSLGMRRSSSFFWTPQAHHDFEKAIGALAARGGDVSPGAIMQLMSHHSDLKLMDIDRHLKKKQLVQRRILQQLNLRDAAAGSADQQIVLSTGQASPTSPPGGLAALSEEPPTPPGGLPPNTMPVGLAEDHGGLIAQLDQQKMQHRQMAAMREQMLAAEDGAPAVMAMAAE